MSLAGKGKQGYVYVNSGTLTISKCPPAPVNPLTRRLTATSYVGSALSGSMHACHMAGATTECKSEKTAVGYDAP